MRQLNGLIIQIIVRQIIMDVKYKGLYEIDINYGFVLIFSYSNVEDLGGLVKMNMKI